MFGTCKYDLVGLLVLKAISTIKVIACISATFSHFQHAIHIGPHAKKKYSMPILLYHSDASPGGAIDGHSERMLEVHQVHRIALQTIYFM